PREGSAGLVIRGGYIVGEWGDLERVDMTFSVAKSYLSTVAGLALRDGLISDLQRPVAQWVRDGHFESEHNRQISWRHLLQQTSDWSGALWDVPDWADRPEGDDPELWPRRVMHEPGSHFKYNDVRVNLLAYSLLQVWREPLPQVLKREVMDPIGASSTWRWHGYENSWVTVDGLRMQSVSGGGHFGGGLFINTLDHARFGLLFLRNGQWDGRQIFSADWIDQLRQPAQAKPDYGYMWWLNTDKERIASAPEKVFYAAGFGGNYIYVDQENDLLIVLRWVPDLAAVVEAVLAALHAE
ncbi:MAG: serine hydrolase, partial [Xanthomonadales bacterium]